MARGVAGFAVTLAVLVAGLADARAPMGGGGDGPEAWADATTPQLEAQIQRESEAAAKALRDAGWWPDPRAKLVQAMRWPLGPDPGVGRAWHGVSNFVDLDARFPNRIRDYTCGTRSYDRTNGYNHRGTDFFVYPFPWTAMDAGAVDVLAAASGTLLVSRDGNDDRSCSFDAPDTPNYVIVQHADGTVARYLHMKRGSVTTKAVGAMIAAGEYLGKVGSSGISTGPHLHFELRASTAPNADVIDPFNGACNGVAGAWAAQRPYFDSRINRLATHAATPVGAACPVTQETPSFSDRFAPGSRVIAGAYYRDQQRGQATQFRVLRPDGSVFQAWSFDLADAAPGVEFYAASRWYWNIDLPGDAPLGPWTFEATYAGETQAHTFVVGATSAIADPRALSGAWYEPGTSGQGFDLHWIEGARLLVFFYGHHDDGTNLFLVGTRDGVFAYGDELEIPVVVTTGGRFNGFDATTIRREPWGSVRLRFDDCDNARATLAGNDGNKQLQLIRLTRQPGLRCDAP